MLEKILADALVLSPRSVYELLVGTSAIHDLKLCAIASISIHDIEALCAFVQGDSTVLPCPLLVIPARASGQDNGGAITVIRPQAF